ncbi:MAG: TAXI family TRAP transporter solute-binding subunit [Leptospiraceae bacterium]|nr:TAXI family TRAP transporter solute-binding subunit [Leptospiraceae bacterium]
MKRIFLITLVFTTLLINCGKNLEFKFASGFQGGTYEKIGESLSKVSNFKVQNQNSKGSIDNIFLVNDKKVDISICQLDVLQNSIIGNAEIKDNVKILFPLYGEEVHLLAKISIESVKDLKGKKVSIGDSDSGTKLTSLIFLSQFGINNDNATLEEFDFKTSLEKLQNGELDALIFIAGYPVDSFSKLPEDSKEKIHLIDFKNESLKMVGGSNIFYKNSEIPSGTYSWEVKPVNTILVQSVLIARSDFSDDDVITFTKSVWKEKDMLATRHDKWKQLSKGSLEFIKEKNKEFLHPAVLKILPDLN